jgi:peptidoglycan/xylan/chitin deacetylase (PgdA/CDA1 family)
MNKHRITLFVFIVAAMACVFFQHYWWLVFVVFLYLLLLFFVVLIPQFNFFVDSLHRIPASGNSVIITFDDGPMPGHTEKVLAVLAEKKAKACFFLIGKNMEEHPGLVKQIIAEGHQVGHHSYSHVNTFPMWSTQKVKEDIAKAASILENITEQQNLRFRIPFGLSNPNIAKAIQQCNFQSIGWSLRTYDTMSKSKEQLVHTVLTKVKAGDIILLHDWGTYTVEALPEIIDGVRGKGLEIGVLA